MIVIDGLVVYEQLQNEKRIHRCTTRRSAQILGTQRELEAVGWRAALPSTSWRFRLPLLLPGERCGQYLDGSRTDERATGLVCWRGGDGPRSAMDLLVFDASVGMPIVVLEERGDTQEVRAIVEWYLEPISE